MTPFITTRFRGVPHDSSIEAAVQRWVARTETLGVEIDRAEVVVTCAKRTSVTVTIRTLAGDWTSAHVHADPYVAVSNAFRALRHEIQVLQSTFVPSRWAYA